MGKRVKNLKSSDLEKKMFTRREKKSLPTSSGCRESGKVIGKKVNKKNVNVPYKKKVVEKTGKGRRGEEKRGKILSGKKDSLLGKIVEVGVE